MLKQREAMLAVKFATMKEIFHYAAGAYTTVSTILVIGVIKTKKPALLAPPMILSFPLHYLYDTAYGDKILKIRAEADRMLLEEPEKFNLPSNNLLITPEDYQKIFGRKEIVAGEEPPKKKSKCPFAKN